MAEPGPLLLDVDLSHRDIQALDGADAVAAFFARLGYNTGVRTPQAPGNLGVNAEGTLQKIKAVELLADQESLLQVYLFELTTVTIETTRSLARTFRNRAGNYLLVLTSDYEELDFVLLQRERPAARREGMGLSLPQSGIRTRTLTVERRKPNPIQLRVLRRLTYTESDPYAQHDKLASAYSVADWSEEFFNNRALFSDYYLRERLPHLPAWQQDPKPAFTALRDLYRKPGQKAVGKNRSELCASLIEPAVQTLGWEPRGVQASLGAETATPHYELLPPSGSGPLAVCLAYPWGRSLDAKDDLRDGETPEDNPGARVVTLLERGLAPWAVVTNGKIWRLYCQRTHSRATNYYEIDLEEVLASGGSYAPELNDSFRYFWLLFRRQAFEPATTMWDGRPAVMSFLDQLLAGSEEYARELGDLLKNKVFLKVFPCLAEGFIEQLRHHSGPEVDLSEPVLDEVFRGTLTLLYRLLFLLYAEARDLLPVKEVRGYYEASLRRLKKEIEVAAGPIADEVEGRLRDRYRAGSFQLYERLLRLCAVVDRGEADLNVPVYNGGLFLSEPRDDDASPEAVNARFLLKHRVSDRHLARALDLLAREIDPKSQALAPIDYKSLGVRQLGSIYEGLLEFKVRIAPRKLAITKEKGREVYVAFSELEEKEQERAERQGRVKPKGSVYLENDKHERKATGSYYTPDHIVQYIVEQTVGPVLEEKFDKLRPQAREAQQKRKAFFDRQKGLEKQGLKPEPQEKADLIGQDLVDQLFNLKVLDPAMGSGHFLVEAVDFITDKTLDFLNAFPWNPVVAHLARMRRTIIKGMEDQGITVDHGRLTDVNLLKRYVLKRCIYGVDMNPMAVELAKVSLWLDCFTLGAPLSFLDHHLRCGNSLIGSSIEEVDGVRAGKGQLLLSASSDWQGLLHAVQGMVAVGGLPDLTASQVSQSRNIYQDALSGLVNFKRILDVQAARWFIPLPSRRARKGQTLANPFDDIMRSGELFEWAHGRPAAVLDGPPYNRLLSDSLTVAVDRGFFHWELEFPEVFYGLRPGSETLVERMADGGFDAVIGNPPYDEPSKAQSNTADEDIAYYSEYAGFRDFKHGRTNLYRLFLIRGLTLPKVGARLSFIIPMSFLGDDFSLLLRRHLLTREQVLRVEAFPQKDDTRNRVFPEAKLSTCIPVLAAGSVGQPIFVRTHPGRVVDPQSRPYSATAGELHRLFPQQLCIPTVSGEEFGLLRKVFMKPEWPRLGDLADIYVGEVFDNALNKRHLSDEQIGPEVLRGAHVDRYLLRTDATQGRPRYLRVSSFSKPAGGSRKMRFLSHWRIGLQRGAAVDNWRRLIACLIPPGHYCFDTVILMVPRDQAMTHVLLGLLNSDLWEWRFRCTSTTNHVNEYELAQLGVPPTLADVMSTAHRNVRTAVAAILAAGVGDVRRSETQNVPASSIDLELDELVFECHGVGPEEKRLVRAALATGTKSRPG